MSYAEPLDFDAKEALSEEQRESANQNVEDQLAKLRWLMSGPKGRSIVWDVFRVAGLHMDLIALPRELAVQPSERALAYSEGKRHQALLWFHLIHSVRELFQFYPLMVEENHFANDRRHAQPAGSAN